MGQGDKDKGLYEKFFVARHDGTSAEGQKHHGCDYFVIDITHDRFAAETLRKYAELCAGEYPLLAKDILKRIHHDGTDTRICPACRQLCPCPTQPGEWEYREQGDNNWSRATIKMSTGEEDHCEPGHLIFYSHEIMNAEDEDSRNPGPHWWPEHAQWRKIK